jgi:hypothetical protein
MAIFAANFRLLKHVVGFLKRRRDGDGENQDQGPPRKRSVTIYGPDETVLREVTIETDGSVAEVPVEPGHRGPHPRPQI